MNLNLHVSKSKVLRDNNFEFSLDSYILSSLNDLFVNNWEFLLFDDGNEFSVCDFVGQSTCNVRGLERDGNDGDGIFVTPTSRTDLLSSGRSLHVNYLKLLLHTSWHAD